MSFQASVLEERKGARLISKIYDMIEKQESLTYKINNPPHGVDKTLIRALTAINVISRLDDEHFDKFCLGDNDNKK